MAKNSTFLFKWQIAELYRVSTRTMSTIINTHKTIIGEPTGYKYSPLQLELLKQIIGDWDEKTSNLNQV